MRISFLIYAFLIYGHFFQKRYKQKLGIYTKHTSLHPRNVKRVVYTPLRANLLDTETIPNRMRSILGSRNPEHILLCGCETWSLALTEG